MTIMHNISGEQDRLFTGFFGLLHIYHDETWLILQKLATQIGHKMIDFLSFFRYNVTEINKVYKGEFGISVSMILPLPNNQ